MIRIDKGIPIPPRPGPGSKYHWDKMAIGDSFFTQNVKGRSLYGCAKRFGVKILTRSVEEDGVKGIRVWRIK